MKAINLFFALLFLTLCNLFAQDDKEKGNVLLNPDGFEMFGKEPEPIPTPLPNSEQPKQNPPPPINNNPQPKTNKTGKGGKLPNVINLSLDLDILYDVYITDTVVIREKRPTVSFKTKEDNKYFYNQAILKVTSKDFGTAVDYLNKCIKTDPYSKELLQLRANALTETGNLKKAVKDYLRVIEIDNNDPIVYYNLGATYLKMAKFKESVQAFDNATQLKPNYLFAYQGKASAKTYLKNYEGAIEDYNRALDLNERFLHALKGRGIAKSMLGRYDEAISDFTRIIELQQMDGMAFYYRGLAYIAENQAYKACADFDRARQLNIPQANQEIKQNCK